MNCSSESTAYSSTSELGRQRQSSYYYICGYRTWCDCRDFLLDSLRVWGFLPYEEDAELEAEQPT